MTGIIWDWNGTLLNDTELCINSINTLLRNRNIPVIDITLYKEVFSFPVKEYYKAIGFDFEKEDFSIPAHQFIDLYTRGFDGCPLQKSAVEVLSFFQNKGIRQFVLSAMEHEMLEKTLEKKGIAHFFEGVAGLHDHYAVSKTGQGKNLIQSFGIDTTKSWLIGDTIHDYEVAGELAVKCLLIADGHQSSERLRQTGARVLPGLEHLLKPEIYNGVMAFDLLAI